jgi:hypothetical protein
MMKDWFKKIEKAFASVSFAEAGEHQTALRILGLSPRPAKGMGWSWDKVFASVTFAEADCPELAREFMEKRKVPERVESLDAFLETIGLKGVEVCYGMAHI